MQPKTMTDLGWVAPKDLFLNKSTVKLHAVTTSTWPNCWHHQAIHHGSRLAGATSQVVGEKELLSVLWFHSMQLIGTVMYSM